MTWPSEDTKYYSILQAVSKLCPESTKGRVHITDIFEEIGGEKETIRSMLYILKRKGFLEQKGRGTYNLTKLGRDIVKN